MKGFKQYLEERKQVGIVYHFTDTEYAVKILKSMALFSRRREYISLTRNSNLKLQTGPMWGEVRFTIDGTKLSDHHKIQPFNDNMPRKAEEWEEAIQVPSNTEVDIMKALISVDIHEDEMHAAADPKDIKKLKAALKKRKIAHSYVKNFKPFKR